MKLLPVEKHVTKSYNHNILHTHDLCSCYLSEMDSCCSIEVQCQVIDSDLHIVNVPGSYIEFW